MLSAAEQSGEPQVATAGPLISSLSQGPRPAAVFADPDRTSRVRVDPWTGEIKVAAIGSPSSAIDRSDVPVQTIPTVSLEGRTLGVTATALVATAAAALGATAGSMVTLLLLG